MALRTAWWMQPQPDPKVHPTLNDLSEEQQHLQWPWSWRPDLIEHRNIEGVLQKSRGTICSVESYRNTPTQDSQWNHEGTANVNPDLIALLRRQSKSAESLLYLASSLNSEAMQALGHYLNLPPRFFSMKVGRLSTGTRKNHYSTFAIHFIDKYRSPLRPSASRAQDQPHTFDFRSTEASRDHVWHTTWINVIFLKAQNEKSFRGLVQIDPLDETVREGLKTLIMRTEIATPGATQEYTGIAQVMFALIRIVSYTWKMFLSEAQTYLDTMSGIVTQESLTYEELVKYTRELHDLRPRWIQARHRIVTTKELLMHITEHRDFTSIYDFKGRIVNESYFSKRITHLDARIARCDELEDQTKALISLILNLATLRDTKKTIEETTASNALAASIRRVTMLGFIYLPLTLASGIFGMNISIITGESAHTHLWVYCTFASSLMVATFGGWFIWSHVQSSIKRRRSERDASSETMNSIAVY